MARSKTKATPGAPPNQLRDRILLIVVLLVFLGSHLWLLLAFEAKLPDTFVYGRLARDGVDGGMVAYRDFEVFYPPVAWWVIEFPRLIDSKSYAEPSASPETIKQFFEWYFKWFHAEVFVADVICLLLTIAIGRRISSLATWGLPAAYTLITLAQPNLLFDRLDIVLLMFLLLWAYSWIRSLETTSLGARPGANYWACASYLFLGLAVSFKIVPLICIPFVFLADLWASRSVWRPAALLLSLAIGGLGPFLIHMPLAGWRVFSLFRFHAEREIHLESIWGSVMLVARAFGVPSDVIYSHGGYDLTGEWHDTLKKTASVSLLAITALLGLWALLRGRRFDRRMALDSAYLALLNSMILSIVFSPQYLNWAVPLALLLAIDIFPRSWIPWSIFTVLVVVILGISSWLFPYHYRDELVALRALPTNLSLIRSACLIGLGLLMSVQFFVKYGILARTATAAAPTDSRTATI